MFPPFRRLSRKVNFCRESDIYETFARANDALRAVRGTTQHLPAGLLQPVEGPRGVECREVTLRLPGRPLDRVRHGDQSRPEEPLLDLKDRVPVRFEDLRDGRRVFPIVLEDPIANASLFERLARPFK